MQEPGKHRANDWGPREVIALVIIVMSFVLAVIAQVYGKPGATIPAWVAALIAGIGSVLLQGNGKGES